jgi:hypothetical protein
MARGDDLSKPKGAAGAGPVYDPDEFGRLAERLARFFGTPRYIIGQTVIVIIWIIVNAAVVILRFDPYPFILLNLAFSTQAAYAAPLILLAQNRQADRDKEESERDREMNARSLAETEYLAREIRRPTRPPGAEACRGTPAPGMVVGQTPTVAPTDCSIRSPISRSMFFQYSNARARTWSETPSERWPATFETKRSRASSSSTSRTIIPA